MYFLGIDSTSILKNEIDLNKSVKNLTYEKVTINLHPEVSCEITLNVARSSEEASTQKKLGKAVTSNSENESDKTEISKEFSVQDEIKTDEKPENIHQEVHSLNEDDKTKENEASREKTLDSDTAG